MALLEWMLLRALAIWWNLKQGMDCTYKDYREKNFFAIKIKETCDGKESYVIKRIP
jgi:hypothetical protein